jgi:hypothetical protein
MDVILRRLPLRNAQEQQPRLTRDRHDQYRVVLRHVTGPDLALKQRGPERGKRVRVPRVEGDLVDLQGSIPTVCHNAQETMRPLHTRAGRPEPSCEKQQL